MEDYSINQIIRHFKAIYTQKNRPVVSIPLWLPKTVFKLAGLVMPERAKFYEYQLRKIAEDNIYSGAKLRSTGVQLGWNMRNTVNKTVE